jgi:site-specific DNA-cytosine methylase
LAELFGLSLFSGAGGLDLGLKNAGFEILASLEIDSHCYATLRAAQKRFGGKTLIYENDIRKVAPKNRAQDLTLKPGQLDLLYCLTFRFSKEIIPWAKNNLFRAALGTKSPVRDYCSV